MCLKNWESGQSHLSASLALDFGYFITLINVLNTTAVMSKDQGFSQELTLNIVGQLKISNLSRFKVKFSIKSKFH